MNVLVAFLITITILLVILIKFKISPAVGLFVSAIIMAVLCQMPSTELFGALNLAGFIVAIPVYFASGYIMLSPLINSLQKLTNKKKSE